MPLDTSSLGQPVDLGQVARELKKLWESTGGTQTRASLVNFAVLCSGAEALEANTQIISNFTREHACRAILIARIDEPGAPPVRTWINAHCHLSRAGAKSICCEQITFIINSGSEQAISNVLYANLDSDLPLYLWWQGELSAEPCEQLWSSVDRLIFDSREWRDLGEQVPRLQRVLAAASARTILCDLNWTRTLHLRQAVAQMFDQPENLALLADVQRVTIQHSPGGDSTALLFASWISAQLGWEATERTGNRLGFRAVTGDEVACELRETAGAPISLFELQAGAGSVSIQRAAGSAFFRADVHLNARPASSHLLPASNDELVNLLDEELTLGGRHRVYLKALNALAPLLGEAVPA
jgi:glucose-6-phosphate dehydrogenase assembly protein OpcA